MDRVPSVAEMEQKLFMQLFELLVLWKQGCKEVEDTGF